MGTLSTGLYKQLELEDKLSKQKTIRHNATSPVAKLFCEGGGRVQIDQTLGLYMITRG